jgi:hypothetical protein
MIVEKAIIAVDKNPVYREYWPLVAQAWKRIGIEPVVMDCLTAVERKTTVPLDHSHGEVIPFEIPYELANQTAFVAQCIRLLAPACFFSETTICLMSDMDIIPLSSSYFHHSLIQQERNDKFLVLRPFNKIPEGQNQNYHETQIPMCYNVASSATWKTLFHFRDHKPLETEGILQQRLIAWNKNKKEWTSDQQFLREYIDHFANDPINSGRVIELGDTALQFKRIDRASDLFRAPYKDNLLSIFQNYPNIVSQIRECADFHLPRPLQEFRNAIASIQTLFSIPNKVPPQILPNHRIVYISFATPNYRESQKRLCDSLQRYGKQVVAYTTDFLTQEQHPRLPENLQTILDKHNVPRLIRNPQRTLFETYQDIFSLSRGSGYWFWKPWILYYTLFNVVGPNDIVVYLDSGMEAISDPSPLENLVDGGDQDRAFFYVPGYSDENTKTKHTIERWTKNDAIQVINPMVDKSAQQVLGGFQVYRKTPETMDFVLLLLNYCASPQLLTDVKSQLIESPHFKEHRHEQAILTLLAYKFGTEKKIQFCRDPSQFGNDFPQANSPYPQIFNLHRNVIAAPACATPPKPVMQPRITSEPFISGDTFRTNCHFILDDTSDSNFEPKQMWNNCIVFVKTDFIVQFIKTLVPQISPHISWTLITHNSDLAIPLADPLIHNFIENCSSLSHWFAQNVNCKSISRDDPALHKITSLPIGFANRCWPHGNVQTLAKFHRKAKSKSLVQKKQNDVYVNFTATRPEDLLRKKILNQIQLETQKMCPSLPFVVAQPLLTFDNYLSEMSTCQFVVCPQGNGIDSHRIWEALLVGCIPIIIYCNKQIALDLRLFKDLPVLIFDSSENWIDIIAKHHIKKRNHVDNLHELNFSFWWSKIQQIHLNGVEKDLLDTKQNENEPKVENCMLNVAHIYIMYYKKNAKRLSHILDFFEQNGIDKTCYTIVSEHDQEDLSPELILKWYQNAEGKVGFHPDPDIQHFMHKKLKMSEISLCIKHLTTMFTIANTSSNDNENENYLFLEDDALFEDNFVSRMNYVLERIPKDLSIGYISEGCGLHIKPSKHQREQDQIKRNSLWVPHPTKRSRTTAAFIITKKCCQSIRTNFERFRLPIDWELMQIHQKLNHSVYWLEPTLVYNGSQNGKYVTSVEK